MTVIPIHGSRRHQPDDHLDQINIIIIFYFHETNRQQFPYDVLWKKPKPRDISIDYFIHVWTFLVNFAKLKYNDVFYKPWSKSAQIPEDVWGE